MAKAGALLSRNMKPMMLRSWVLKQLSPRPSRKLQSIATPTLGHDTQTSEQNFMYKQVIQDKKNTCMLRMTGNVSKK